MDVAVQSRNKYKLESLIFFAWDDNASSELVAQGTTF